MSSVITASRYQGGDIFLFLFSWKQTQWEGLIYPHFTPRWLQLRFLGIKIDKCPEKQWAHVDLSLPWREKGRFRVPHKRSTALLPEKGIVQWPQMGHPGALSIKHPNTANSQKTDNYADLRGFLKCFFCKSESYFSFSFPEVSLGWADNEDIQID